MDDLTRQTKLNTLFSYYAPLLTNRQQTYFKYYYYDNYSLAEIANICGVSRNAVFDQLEKISKKLEEFEQKLHLAKHQGLRNLIVEEIRKTNNIALLSMLLKVGENND